MTIEELGKRVDAAIRLNKRIDNIGAEVQVFMDAEFDGLGAKHEYRIKSTHHRITGGLVVLLEPICSSVLVLHERGASPPA